MNPEQRLENIKCTAAAVAESLVFSAPELIPMHVQRLLDEIFEDDPANRPVVFAA